MNRRAGGRLYDPEWPDHSIFVSPQLIQKYQLPAGARLTGPTRKKPARGGAGGDRDDLRDGPGRFSGAHPPLTD